MSIRRLAISLCALIVCGLTALSPFMAGADQPSPSFILRDTQYEARTTQLGDWPTYAHDNQRTSYNPDETTISATNVALLTQAWQAPIGISSQGGTAFTAPSVANGKVFIASSFDDGDNFFAFDAATGSLSWSASIGYNPGECFGLGIGSTPAISGTVVTIGGGDSAYYGLSTLDGSQLWRDPLGVGPSGFAWTSPLVANGRAYVGVASDCDNPSVRGELRSLDLPGGTHLGSAYMVPEGEVGAGIWNSPALSPDGSKIIVATGEDYAGYDGPLNRALVVLDAYTLQVLGSNKQGRPDHDEDWSSTPTVFHDSTGRLMVGANHKNGTFYAYNLNNVSAGPVWSWQTGLIIALPVAYDPSFGDGGTLIFSFGGRLRGVDPANGSQRWFSDFHGATAGNIAVANGLVYVNNVGTLKIVNERDGTLLRSITPPLSGSSLGGPVVSNGMIYWSSGAYINAWHVGPPPPTPTYGPSPTTTSSPTYGPTPEPPPCPGGTFTDVCPTDYFYNHVLALNADGILSGYNTAPPCNNDLWIPCFKPYNSSTRGQISKVVSLAAGFNEPVSGRLFEDVPPGSTYYTYTERLAEREIVSGYPCGGPGEPCGPNSLPYFRPNSNVTRGQLAKITVRSFGWNDPVTGQQFEDVPPDSTFYDSISRLYNRGIVQGYPCGDPGEPCVPPDNHPYFRPNNNVLRAQTAKIVQLARTQPTPTPIPTPTSLATGTPTPTASVSPTSTVPMPSSTPTTTGTPTVTDTPVPTATPSPGDTSTPTDTPLPTDTPATKSTTH
jgi:outer membrane protein assembly factor BamB